MAKARVTPLKAVTIPRLELTAALVSVKVASLIKKELTLRISREIFWSDSKVVLSYISNDSRRFHVFVANRVQEIRDKTDPRQWAYVRSSENPADYASRGLYAREILNNELWWSGPKYLQQNI